MKYLESWPCVASGRRIILRSFPGFCLQLPRLVITLAVTCRVMESGFAPDIRFENRNTAAQTHSGPFCREPQAGVRSGAERLSTSAWCGFRTHVSCHFGKGVKA